MKGIPKSPLSYAHVIREDPVRKGLLYLGTENALYVSFDDGGEWQPLQNNLPHAPVYWLAVQPHFHDLVVATYGRGFYILDDLTPLEQWTPEITHEPVALLKPRDQYRFRSVADPFTELDDIVAGENPQQGAAAQFLARDGREGHGDEGQRDDHDCEAGGDSWCARSRRPRRRGSIARTGI